MILEPFAADWKVQLLLEKVMQLVNLMKEPLLLLMLLCSDAVFKQMQSDILSVHHSVYLQPLYVCLTSNSILVC